MRRSDLERLLDQVPPHPAPRPELEQYRTPSAIAAQLLWHAKEQGAIEGRRVLDLGSGTGVFAIGAAALGAQLATGVEADPQAVAIARDAAARLGFRERTWFVAADLAAWRPDAGAFDTVVMNPPFGAQKENRHADRLFLERAAEAVRPAGSVWFLAQERTEAFLAAFAQGLGARIDRVAAWDYPLQATMAHHAREARMVRVGGYRLSWP